MNQPHEKSTASSPGVSRRNIIAAVWAAPVVAVAIAAPAATASGGSTASEITILNDPGPITGQDGLAVIVVRVLDNLGNGVSGLVSATLASSGTGRFDVGFDDSAVTETQAQVQADSDGYVTFSVVQVAAGSVAVVISSGSVSTAVTVEFA